MPPAAQFAFESAGELPYDGNGVFDVGAIEVEALLGQPERAVVTRISMVPRNDTVSKGNTRNRGMLCLADSFDSTEEQKELTNDARWDSGSRSSTPSLRQPVQHQLDETEAKYLEVLDNHLDATSETIVFSDPDDPHPSKTRGNIEQIMDHLIDHPCCECSDAFSRQPLKSSLRPSRWGQEKRAVNPASQEFATGEKTVGFKNVDIREFKMTLGNHPSATSGPPVMLDWEACPKEHVIDLDSYERGRRPRRSRRQLKLSLQQRHNILVKEQGFAFDEVKHAWQEALEIRKQRKETLERGLALMKLDEVWESTCRKFNRLVDGSI